MKKYICPCCKKEFFDYDSNNRKFCSQQCRNKITKPHLGHRHTEKCKKIMSIKKIGKHISPETEFKKGQKSWNKNSKMPQYSLDKHWNWKGGKIKSSFGYMQVKQSDHPFVDKRGYVFEHRLVMEEKLGRYLNQNEIVHHINGIKDDNRIENLELMGKRDHDRFETKKRWSNGNLK